MTPRRFLEIAFVSIVGLVVVLLLLGSLLGQPVVVSYVDSDSMEPTIAEGDGFVAIPAAVAGPVEEGDVIVYGAQEGDADELTTHRVVDSTEHGYVTRGDANVVTDQDGSEPHVTDGQVAATAWQVQGDVVTIPHLGTAVMGVQNGLESAQFRLASLLGAGVLLGPQGLSSLLIGFGILVLALSLVFDSNTRSQARSRTRARVDALDARTLVVAMGVLLCVVTIATMMSMSGSTEFATVSADYDSDAPHVIAAGETENRTYTLQNGGVLPVVTMVEPASSSVAVDEEPTRLRGGESTNGTVAVTAPAERGYYVHSFAEYRYFAVLPTSVIAGLHAIHPWMAMAAVTGVVVSPFVLPFALLVGTGRVTLRNRSRSSHGRGLMRRLR